MTIGHQLCGVRRKIHKEDILQAGMDLMFERGYHGTGIKDITDKMEIPKGSFYNHFDSKEQFALEVVQMYSDNGLKMYQARFLNPKLPPLKRVESFFDTLIGQYENVMHYRLGCVMGNFSVEMSDVNDNFKSLLDTEFNRLEGVVQACFQEAQDNGDLSKDKDPAQLAAFLINSWHGALMRMKSTGNAKPLEDCKAMVLSLCHN